MNLQRLNDISKVIQLLGDGAMVPVEILSDCKKSFTAFHYSYCCTVGHEKASADY